MKTLKKILFIAYRLFHHKKCVVFESGNNEFDNGYVFFQYCLKNNVFPNNKLVFLSTKSKKEFKNIASKNFYHYKTGKFGDLSLGMLSKNSDFIFFSYDNFWKYYELPNTKLVFIKHGEFPIKSVKNYYDSMFLNKNHYYVLCNTEFVKETLSDKYGYDNVTYFVSGMPRNDLAQLEPNQKCISTLGLDSAKTNILVACTFRSFYKETNFFKDEFALKLDDDQLNNLRKTLKENNICLIFKFHHAQKISSDMENDEYIKTISTDELEKNGLCNFDLFSVSDAMITDFSNIYMGYLKNDKPLGFLKADLESYGSSRGFTVDNIDELQPGVNIFNYEEFINFLMDVKNKNDNQAERRKEVRGKLLGEYENSCESLVEYIRSIQ